MLHQVDPTPPQAFEPNRILKVTPSFLEDVCARIDAGFDIILSMTAIATTATMPIRSSAAMGRLLTSTCRATSPMAAVTSGG